MRILLMLGALVAVALTGCSNRETAETPTTTSEDGGKTEMAVKVTSSAFKDGERIPEKYTGEGANVSPPLEFVGVPEETEELALICDDPDAPRPEPWVHWVLYGLPGNTTCLAEGSSAEGKEGPHSSGGTGYTGPMPPPGHGTHHYHFKVYALDVKMDLKAGVSKKELLSAMEGHILAQGELVGTYSRE